MIKTERLALRQLQQHDCEVLVHEFSNYNIVRNTARIPFPYHLSDAEEYLKFASQLNPRSKSLAIALKSDPQILIGAISYLFSEEKNDAELGYWLSEPHWGNGYMSEAARAMIDNAVKEANITTFVACYHDDNPASGKILEKLGFVFQGKCNNFSKAQGKEVPVTNTKLVIPK